MKSKYLVSISEAASIFGIGKNTLYALSRTEPDIPIILIGMKKKVNIPLMEEWLNKVTREGRKL